MCPEIFPPICSLLCPIRIPAPWPYSHPAFTKTPSTRSEGSAAHVCQVAQTSRPSLTAPIAPSERDPKVGWPAYYRLHPSAPKLIQKEMAKPTGEHLRANPVMPRTGQDILSRDSRPSPRVSAFGFGAWKPPAREISKLLRDESCGAPTGPREGGHRANGLLN